MTRIQGCEDISITNSKSSISFDKKGGGNWPIWHRYISIEGKPAYEIGNICGTCQFYFERLEGANKSINPIDAIEQLNYRPNLNARGLASNRSFLVGLFCDRPGDYLSEFQAGAVERCRESSIHLMVEPWDVESPDIENQLDTLLGQLRLEGVILLPPLSDHQLARHCARKSIRCEAMRDDSLDPNQLSPAQVAFQQEPLARFSFKGMDRHLINIADQDGFVA